MSLLLALDPILDTQATFRIVLEAMARPGTVQQLPVAAREAPTNPWLAALLITLLDGETSLAVTPFDGADALANFVQLRTRVRLADAVEGADFVLTEAHELDAALLRRLRLGTLEFPDDSATLIVQVPGFLRGVGVTCKGPGVADTVALRIEGIDAGFVTRRAELERLYPRGIDVLLVDQVGHVMGLPRSSRVQLAEA